MTREDVIYEAANKYSESLYAAISAGNGFIAGVKWADENPKNPWIRCEDDLPYTHSELCQPFLPCFTRFVLVQDDWGEMYVTYMVRKDDGWHWHVRDPWRKITHWMPIPEIPKED